MRKGIQAVTFSFCWIKIAAKIKSHNPENVNVEGESDRLLNKEEEATVSSKL